MPGGGFIAGLVIGIALIMQYMASGYAWADQQMRVDYHALIGVGVLIAGVTGIGAWFGDLPFLTSGYDYFHLPLIGEVELATAMAFDLGVFLTVVGVVMLTLANLSRVGRKAEPHDRPTTADGHRPAAGRRSGELRWSCWSPAPSGVVTAVGIYLVLRAQTFPVVLGLTFLSYAVNVYLFAMGRLVVGLPPIITKTAAGLHRPPAPGAGADRDRDLVRHDGAARRPGAARLSRDRARPCRRPLRHAGGRRMNHWLIVPVVLPALVAPFIVAAARYDIVLQRVFAIAATVALLAVAVGLYALASDGVAAALCARQLAGAVRHRPGAGPAVGADAAAHRDAGRRGGGLRRRRAGTGAAATSTRCSSSSSWASTAPSSPATCSTCSCSSRSC